MPAVTHLYDLSFLKIILNIFFFSFLDSPCLKNDKTFVLGFVCLEIYFLRFSGLGQTDYLGRVQNNKRHRLFSLKPFDMDFVDIGTKGFECWLHTITFHYEVDLDWMLETNIRDDIEIHYSLYWLQDIEYRILWQSVAEAEKTRINQRYRR